MVWGLVVSAIGTLFMGISLYVSCHSNYFTTER